MLDLKNAVVGEEVIVISKESSMHRKIGEIWKINLTDDPIIVSVVFDGDVCSFHLKDLSLS